MGCASPNFVIDDVVVVKWVSRSGTVILSVVHYILWFKQFPFTYIHSLRCFFLYLVVVEALCLFVMTLWEPLPEFGRGVLSPRKEYVSLFRNDRGTAYSGHAF